MKRQHPMKRPLSIVAGIVAAASLYPAFAQDYPSKPIRVISATTAGAQTDVIARLFGAALGERLRQSVIIENRPGPASIIAGETVLHAPPDGYTLLAAAPGFTMMPVMKKNPPYDPLKDFVPIANLASTWVIYAVYPGFPAQTLAEFIAYAKARPNKVRYGSNGFGSQLHLAAEMLVKAAGIQIDHIPYKSGGQLALALMTGEVDMAALVVGSVSGRGKMRPLAQAGPARHPLFPDVPTTRELGLPGLNVETWFGLTARSGTPPALVARLQRELESVQQLQPIREKLQAMGWDTRWIPGAAFASYLAEDISTWTRITREAGIPMED